MFEENPRVIVVVEAAGRQLVGVIDTIDDTENPTLYLRNPLQYVERQQQGAMFAPILMVTPVDGMVVHTSSVFELPSDCNLYREYLKAHENISTQIRGLNAGLDLSGTLPKDGLVGRGLSK